MGRHIRACLYLVALVVLPSCEPAPQPRAPAVQLELSEPCDVQLGCRAASESLAVTVIFATDMRALQPFPLKLLVEAGNQIKSVSVNFAMQGMDMGWNRYSLSSEYTGVWNTTVTLPICSTSRTDWIADFDLQADGRHHRVQVPFVLDE